MDRLILRRMQEADLDQIASLETEIFSVPWSRKAYQDIWDQERYCALVLAIPCQTPGEGVRAEEGCAQEIIGFLCGMAVLEEGELHRIAISPSQRGKGYGQMLLEEFFGILRREGVCSVYLEVRAGNKPAVRLYEKNGFTAIGVRRGYYQNPKEDAWIMQKTI